MQPITGSGCGCKNKRFAHWLTQLLVKKLRMAMAHGRVFNVREAGVSALTACNVCAGALEAARARLAVLLADPATQLGHIAAELAAATGSGGDGAAEEALGRGLRRLLARDSPGFKVSQNRFIFLICEVICTVSAQATPVMVLLLCCHWG